MKADKIQLYGVGSSAVAALDMYNKLCRVGLNARFSQDVHCQLLGLRFPHAQERGAGVQL